MFFSDYFEACGSLMVRIKTVLATQVVWGESLKTAVECIPNYTFLPGLVDSILERILMLVDDLYPDVHPNLEDQEEAENIWFPHAVDQSQIRAVFQKFRMPTQLFKKILKLIFNHRRCTNCGARRKVCKHGQRAQAPLPPIVVLMEDPFGQPFWLSRTDGPFRNLVFNCRYLLLLMKYLIIKF